MATRARAGGLKVFRMRSRRCEELASLNRVACLQKWIFFFSSMIFVPKVSAKNLSSTFGFTEKKCFKGPVCNI